MLVLREVFFILMYYSVSFVNINYERSQFSFWVERDKYVTHFSHDIHFV